MANTHEITDALQYQIEEFLKYIGAEYTTSPTDIDSSLVWYTSPFDASDEDYLKSLLGVENYGFVLSDVVCESMQPHATGYLKFEYTATIYVFRRTLQAKNITDKTNLILQGGTDAGSNVVTSMDRVCSDMVKWFNDYTKGGKLANALSDEQCFRCDITNISNLSNTGSFYWKALSFRALSMESNTISAS